MSKIFRNASEAFENLYFECLHQGVEIGNGTKALRNVSFYIDVPYERNINIKWRKFSEKYADHEFDWYESGDRHVHIIGRAASIWNKMGRTLNSNYGHQLRREGQFGKIVNLLAEDKHTRRAVMTVYDGKELTVYRDDTPCLLSLTFDIDIDNQLNMSAHFRSQDIVYGWCNDNWTLTEYFYRVFRLLSYKIYPELRVGKVHWFINNLHLYKKHYEMHLR